MPKSIMRGEPTLFFSTNQADKSWRLKEKIIAIIESYLQDREDVFTYSSTKIKDIIGQLEEVDVAYTSISDPMSFFSFIEVRDRSNNVGRPYIQEIMGKKTSLNIDKCRVVSTKGFSPNAILLASRQNIPLRLLLPESKQNIKRWFKPDFFQVEYPAFKIIKCSVLVTKDNKTIEFKGGIKKILENNILVRTNKLHEYNVISISRVFNVDVMQNPERKEKAFANIPADGKYQKATIAIIYESPRLYLKAELPQTDTGKTKNFILPVKSIVFFTLLRRPVTCAKVSYQYKYLDAINNEKIGELIIGSFKIENKTHYICLLRYNCDAETCQLGGAFFA